MKKRYIFITVLILTVPMILSACGFSLGGIQMSDSRFSSSQDEANSRVDKLLEALESKDKESVKSMFSQTAIDNSENFDSNLDELMDLFHGEFVSYDDKGAVDTEDTVNGSERLKILYSTYDVTTTEQMYRIAIKDVVIDTEDEENVGISSFYIIKFEDDTDPRYAYSGDLKDTPGINLNIKNVIRNELAE